MHQTSSRLLRMTEDDRPFIRGLQCSEQDFKDLFSTLMVSLPLTSHRVLESNAGPQGPVKDSNHDDYNNLFYGERDGEIGVHEVSGGARNGIYQKHVNELLDSPKNIMQLVILERETETDKLVHDEATVQVLFRRFASDTGPNLKVHSSGSDSDSMSDYATGLIGVRMQRSRRNDKEAPNPALRLLFREYLRETHCEENLAFYVEVRSFLAEYERAKRDTSLLRLDIIRETLALAYSLYNAFLAPGSPCELNIDHNLRNALAGRMTRAVGEDEQMLKSLDEVAVLFDQAQSSVFKLMASDSVPKFSRKPKYARVLRERNLEGLMNSFASASIS
ncbi:Developmental regulator [Hortaea werneckii]|nr:Developmental regulator [Hortaea werneckii]